MGDNLQSLRRLAKRFNIRNRREGEEWPEAHRTTFQNIKSLSQNRFDTYIPEVSASNDKPWRQQTKKRAQWLVERAKRLVGQDSNEAGWRFALENEVLRRFMVEVACPNCRARVWESEIQSTWYNDDDEYGQRLEARRKQRVSCQCPPEQRPNDFYDLGTNRIFDDRVDEFVIYDDLVKSHLPKQAPDRVFGLQNTPSFQTLLDSSARPEIRKAPDNIVSDLITSTPFKTEADPLLFPFLVLEAKSESSSRGSEAILTQSFFPIRALLKLQDDLRSFYKGEVKFEPLVWFFASRGDNWKLYCGTVVKEENEAPTKYETTLLWSGSLLREDDALQLVLFVDYIMDWARDVYRLAILRLLKSMVTGQPFDQISLAYSEMSSMRRDVSRWIPAPPSTAFRELEIASESDGHGNDISSKPIDHEELLGLQIPKTKVGSLRSASESERRFTCLYLTEGLLPSFLQVIAGPRKNQDNTEKAARQTIHFVSQFDDVLVMAKRDLDMIESLWTGKAIAADPDEVAEDLYVVMEAHWYFGLSWELIKELSCFAITKSAFNTLQIYANLTTQQQGFHSRPERQRRCTRSIIQDCLECLKSCSPWQILLSVISRTVVTIYPLPTRRRNNLIPPVDVLGFGYVKYSQVRSFVTKFLKKNLWKPKDIENVRIKAYRMGHYMSLGFTRQEIFERRTIKPPKHIDMAWKRISRQQVYVSEEESHIREKCKRCTLSPESNISRYAHGFLDTRIVPVLSDYKAVLVVSLHENKHRQFERDACVFALGDMKEVVGNFGFSTMLEDLLQLGLIYHTTLSAVNEVSPTYDFRGNLPLPYRSVTNEERHLLKNWIKELRNEPLSTSRLDGTQNHLGKWDAEVEFTDRLMFLLGIGHSEEEATVLAATHEIKLDYAIDQERSFGDRLLFRKIKLSGENTAQKFSSWEEGREFLKREYPKHMAYVESFRMRFSIPTQER